MVDPNTYKTTLIDFGLAELVEESDASIRDSGSYEYLAPEKIAKSSSLSYDGKENHFSGFKADIWGLGVILYAMLFGQFPWSKNERKQFIEKNDQHPQLKFPSSAEFISEEAKDLMKQIFTVDFQKRPSIEEITAHPWLKPRRKTFPFPKLMKLLQ
jgi:serine/threonine protein kinase